MVLPDDVQRAVRGRGQRRPLRVTGAIDDARLGPPRRPVEAAMIDVAREVPLVLPDDVQGAVGGDRRRRRVTVHTARGDLGRRRPHPALEDAAKDLGGPVPDGLLLVQHIDPARRVRRHRRRKGHERARAGQDRSRGPLHAVPLRVIDHAARSRLALPGRVHGAQAVDGERRRVIALARRAHLVGRGPDAAVPPAVEQLLRAVGIDLDPRDVHVAVGGDDQNGVVGEVGAGRESDLRAPATRVPTPVIDLAVAAARVGIDDVRDTARLDDKRAPVRPGGARCRLIVRQALGLEPRARRRLADDDRQPRGPADAVAVARVRVRVPADDAARPQTDVRRARRRARDDIPGDLRAVTRCETRQGDDRRAACQREAGRQLDLRSRLLRRILTRERARARIADRRDDLERCAGSHLVRKHRIDRPGPGHHRPAARVGIPERLDQEVLVHVQVGTVERRGVPGIMQDELIHAVVVPLHDPEMAAIERPIVVAEDLDRDALRDQVLQVHIGIVAEPGLVARVSERALRVSLQRGILQRGAHAAEVAGTPVVRAVGAGVLDVVLDIRDVDLSDLLAVVVEQHLNGRAAAVPARHLEVEGDVRHVVHGRDGQARRRGLGRAPAGGRQIARHRHDRGQARLQRTVECREHGRIRIIHIDQEPIARGRPIRRVRCACDHPIDALVREPHRGRPGPVTGRAELRRQRDRPRAGLLGPDRSRAVP